MLTYLYHGSGPQETMSCYCNCGLNFSPRTISSRHLVTGFSHCLLETPPLTLPTLPSVLVQGLAHQRSSSTQTHQRTFCSNVVQILSPPPPLPHFLPPLTPIPLSLKNPVWVHILNLQLSFLRALHQRCTKTVHLSLHMSKSMRVVSPACQ